ncbi:MAG: SMP-30/gluconolactonase/LRE family protein [Actinobacteria bacterium]|nr:SMP-30/gluconolactonase/LRE family protein [Actinomycetota bacterium]
MSNVELFYQIDAIIGEGAYWDWRTKELLMVDILSGRVIKFSPQGDLIKEYQLGNHVGAVIGIEDSDDYLLVEQRGLSVMKPTGDREQLLTLITDDVRRFNDAKADPTGRLWAGVMGYHENSGDGALYSYQYGGLMHQMIDALSVANGLDWTSDGKTMYFIDSPTRKIGVYDINLATSEIKLRSYIDIPIPGNPDGMTLDADDNLWVALWGGSCVIQLSPEGKLLRKINLPVTKVASCTFGGQDLTTLFITTASWNIDEELAGSVFSIETDTQGKMANLFKKS